MSTALTVTTALQVVQGTATVLSTDVARHFGKRHRDVIRAIENLCADLPNEHLRNFAQVFVEVDAGQGAKAQYPAYRLSRDGFTLLAMGFTGKNALAFKLAYIDAFNQMEARLRGEFVAPLVEHEEFRKTVPLRWRLKLQEQGQALMNKLVGAQARPVRQNLYWQLRQVNDTLGIPTAPMAALVGDEPPLLSP